MTVSRSAGLSLLLLLSLAACGGGGDSTTAGPDGPGAGGSDAGSVGGAGGGKAQAGAAGSSQGKAGSGQGKGGAAGTGHGAGMGGGGSGLGTTTTCHQNDGKVDQKGCSCPTAGATQKCFVGDQALAGVGACTFGTQTCTKIGMGESSAQQWGACTGSGAPGPETCNGVDSDCDGKIDDGCACENGASDMKGCAAQCPQGGGQRSCVNGQWGGCTCKCVAEACSTLCGQGVRNCDGSGTLGACSVAPVTMACQCSNGLSGSASCSDGQMAPCKCACAAQACTTACGSGMTGCDASGNPTPCVVASVTQACSCPNGAAGMRMCQNGQAGTCMCQTQCTSCFQNTCSWAAVQAMSQNLGVADPTVCMASYNQFVMCAMALPPGTNVIACDGKLAPGDPQECLSLVRTIVDCAWQTCGTVCMQ